MGFIGWLTIVWFALTYVGLAFGRVPGLRIDRAGISLVGAALMLCTGMLTFQQGVEAVNFETLVLLFGMMIVVGQLRLSGFFERLGARVLDWFHRPLPLLGVTIGLAGVLSAFLVNDIVCLALTPLVLQLTRRLGLAPLPFLIGLATAANIGSAATITGNPQNMIIGLLSEIPYARFAERLAPPAAIGLLIDFVLIAVIYRKQLQAPARAPDNGSAKRPAWTSAAHHRLMVKSLVVTFVAVVLFFLKLPIELVALGAAAVLVLSRVRPKKIFDEVDWSLLVMFAGLFVVVHAFELHVVRHWDIGAWEPLREHPIGVLSWVSLVLSNLVSNVPAVLLFKPVIAALPGELRETAWLALAMSSTFAGNLTVLGSVANLIVVEIARKKGTPVSFWEYCRVGVPVTLLTLLIGIAWLSFT